MSEVDGLIIKVHYPLTLGVGASVSGRKKGRRRLVLRTSLDWERDLEAEGVNAGKSCALFRVRTLQPYFYFKPCVVDDDSFHWSKGANYLAVTSSNTVREVWPYFFAQEGGVLSVPLDIKCRGRRHRVRIYHPPGYHENTLKRFPVLYMHDGQNLFFPRESFLGVDWQVDETMDVLNAMNAIEKVIVVGIYPQDRMVDYTSPGYEDYGRFIVETLKPTIDRQLRTFRGARHTAVMGSSLGGVVSFHLAWTWPRVFGRVACMSSTFDWRDDLMQRVATDPKRRIKIYLDSGWPRDNYEVTRGMFDLLLKRGYHMHRDLLYFTFPHHRHTESAWATRCHIPLQFFFTRTPVFDRSQASRLTSSAPEQGLLRL